jgi:hypothetical protein
MKIKNLLMIAIAVFGIATTASAQVPNYVPTNGLVGWWPFNGNANDESGNGNNGTVYGATLATDRFGVSNKAYSFDGVNDGVEVDNTILPNIPNSYTINFWCLLDTFNLTANGYTIFDDCDSLQWGGKGRFFTNSSFFENSNFHFREYNNNIANDSAFIGQWINYTCVLNLQNSKFLLYRNATLVDSANFIASSYVGGDRKTQIGRCQSPISYNGMDYFTSFWDGKIDDFGVWNRALSQQEITDLSNSILGLQVPINENSINLYPNPTNGNITLETSSELVGKLYSILDFSGRIIREGKISSAQEQIDLQGVARGVYYLSIENGSSVIKLVKQ